MSAPLDTITILCTTVIHFMNVILTAYLVRVVSRDVFLYLNHRLDVLGKDAFVLYPRARYRETSDHRPVRRQPSITKEHESLSEDVPTGTLSETPTPHA